MIRTQIQLTEFEYTALKKVAKATGRSMADCVREGVGLFLHRAQSSKDDLSAVAGRFRPLPTDDLKPHDRDWADSAV